MCDLLKLKYSREKAIKNSKDNKSRAVTLKYVRKVGGEGKPWEIL